MGVPDYRPSAGSGKGRSFLAEPGGTRFFAALATTAELVQNDRRQMLPTAGNAIAATLAIAGLWILFRQSKNGRDAVPFALAALPFAILVLVIPIPLVSVQTIRAFQNVGASGEADGKAVARLALGIARPLAFAALQFVGVLCVATAIHFFGGRRDQPADSSPDSPVKSPKWPPWLLMAAPLLIIPAAVLTSLIRGIGSLLMEAGRVVGNPAAPATVAGMDLAEFSRLLSTRLIVGTLGGGALVAMALLLAAGSVLAHRFGSRSDAIEWVSPRLLFLVGVFGVWNLLELAVSIRAYTH
jgi:uncharacterized membrane protein